MNYSTIKTFDIANGIGCRTSIFVSGCRNKCEGCFNKETWPFSYGKVFGPDTIDYILETLKPEYIEGLSVLGGEPLEPENQKDVLKLVTSVKDAYPDKGIWLWTGFYWDDLFNELSRASTVYTKDILKKISVLVDGPYNESSKSLGLRFRGSSNQTLIDVPKSLLNGFVVEWKDVPLFDSHEWT